MFSSYFRPILLFYLEKLEQVWTSRLNLDLCISTLESESLSSNNIAFRPVVWEQGSIPYKILHLGPKLQVILNHNIINQLQKCFVILLFHYTFMCFVFNMGHIITMTVLQLKIQVQKAYNETKIHSCTTVSFVKG